jgi:NADPH-dependent glutamate synthase beta subunit-like oxidoreductase
MLLAIICLAGQVQSCERNLSLPKETMPSNAPIKSVAVIGAGPSGLSAVKALDEEKTFDTIRVFERRDQVGGTWCDICNHS